MTGRMSDWEWEQYCKQLKQAPVDVEPRVESKLVQYVLELQYVPRIGGWMKIWCSSKHEPGTAEAQAISMAADKRWDRAYHQHKPNDTFTGVTRMLLLEETFSRQVSEIQPMWTS